MSEEYGCLAAIRFRRDNREAALHLKALAAANALQAFRELRLVPGLQAACS
jgi:hypothetical protein